MATFSINIDVNSKSVNELEQDLQSLEAQFKTLKIGDPGFTELGNKIKGVRSQLKDVDLQFEGLDKEQRATALVDTFQGLVGAVGAVSSAFIAFGGESKAIEDAEKKLLGVIGVVNGLRDVSNSLVAAGKLFGPTFSKIGDSIKAGFTAGATGAQTFKAALVSTGIGAFIVIVGLLVDALSESANASGDAEEAAKKFGDALAGINRQYSVERTTAQEALNTNLKKAELEGKSIEEVADIRDKSLKQQIDIANREVQALLNQQSARQKEIAQLEKDAKKRKEIIEKEFGEGSAFRQASFRLGDELAKLEAQRDQNILDLQIKQNEKRKKLLEDRKKFIINAEKDLVAALQALRLSEAKTEEEQARVTLVNELANLETERKAKVAEANKLGLNVFKINQTYDALNEKARKEYYAKIAQIDEAAFNKQIAQIEESISQISTATQRQVSELDFFYDEILDKFQKLTVPEFIDIIKKSDPKKFFSETIDQIKKKYEELKISEDELAISTIDNIEKSAEIAKKKTRERALDEIKILEDGQKQQISLFDREIELVREKFAKQKQLALTNGESLDSIFKAEEAAVQDVEKKKQAAFTQTQITKKQIAEKAAKDEVEITTKTAEEIQKIQFAQAELAIQYAQSLTNSLQTFSEARANNEINGIQKQIDAEVNLAKSRGATQEEIEKITVAGQARLDQANEEAFNKQKKFAVAQALLDGTSAVLRIFANAAANPKSILFPAQPYVEAAIAAVFTAAKVAQISSTSYSGGGGGAAGGAGAGSTGYNSVGGQILNPFGSPGGGTNILPPRLAPPSTGGKGGAEKVQAGFGGEQTPVVRAYVLAGDVTEAVDAEARLNQKRTL